MDFPDIMIDIETLGTEDHAAIVQIGAVRFDIYGTGVIGPDQFSCQIDWDSANFGKIEPDTLQWWLSQDAAVRNRVFRQEGAASLPAALRSLDGWVTRSGPVATIWSCPPNFDARACCAKRTSGVGCPTAFRSTRNATCAPCARCSAKGETSLSSSATSTTPWTTPATKRSG